MLKFVFSAFVCLALAVPATAQDCCESAPVDCAPVVESAPACKQRTRKRLALVPVKRSVPSLVRKCVTDECGCTRRKWSIERSCYEGSRLGLVDRDPCDKGFLRNLLGRRSASCGCEAPVADDCGCDAPVEAAPCGCDAAPAVVEAAPCGCGS